MLTKKQYAALKRLTKMASSKSYDGEGTIIVAHNKMFALCSHCALLTTHVLNELSSEMGEREEAHFTTGYILSKGCSGNSLAERELAKINRAFEQAKAACSLDYTLSTHLHSLHKKLATIQVDSLLYTIHKSVLDDCATLKLHSKIVAGCSAYALFAHDETTEFIYVLQPPPRRQ